MGEAFQLKIGSDCQLIAADGSDLSFITITITEGMDCRNANNKVNFQVEGLEKL